MSDIHLNDTAYHRFNTVDGSGNSVDADSLPTVDVEEDGGAAAAMGCTITDIGTGLYRVTIPVTTGNGYEVGRRYNVMVHATVGGNASSKQITEFYCRETPGIAGIDNVNTTHIESNAASQILRQIRRNTAQAGAASTITLDASASATDDFYKDQTIFIVSGTGVGQARTIASYVGSTKVATIYKNWATNPDNTSVFIIIATPAAVESDILDFGTAQAGGSNSITLRAGASSVSGAYAYGCYVVLVSGNGAGQVGRSTSYNTGTKLLNVRRDWDTAPNNTTFYLILASSSNVDVWSWLGVNLGAPAISGLPDVNVSRWVAGSPNALVSGRVDASVGAVAADAITAAAIADNAIDRATFAQDAKDLFGEVRRNTAQAGTATTITLDASASAVDDFYNGSLIVIVGGTGVGQARSITNYTGASKIADVEAWVVTPDNTSVFELFGQFASAGGGLTPAQVSSAVWDAARGSFNVAGSFGEGVRIAAGAIAQASFAQDALDLFTLIRRNTAQAGAAGNITLDASASSTNEFYTGDILYIASGLGIGQARVISAYDGATKVATVAENWVTNPNNTSVFVILANGTRIHTLSTAAITAIQSGLATTANVTAVPGNVWEELIASHNTAGTFGAGVRLAANAVSAAAIAAGAFTLAKFANDVDVQVLRTNTAQAGAASTITLDAGASATNDFYKGTKITIIGGAGLGQTRIISAYNGATKVATLGRNWAVNPDNTSVFQIAPEDDSSADPGAVWDVVRAGHNTPGTFGEGVASVQGNVTGSVGSIAAGGIAAASFAANAITNTALAASAITAIQSGMATVANQTTILGLLHRNAVIDSTSHSVSGLLTAARLRVFASAAAANAAVDGAADDADGEVERYTITATDEGAARLGLYRLVKVL